MWRALKGLTEADALEVVAAVKDQDGWIAWMALHKNYEQSLLAMQGKTLIYFGALASRPAKTPEETRKLLIEFENRFRSVEDVSQREVDAMHAKSILIAILDPATRQHTAHLQALGVPEFKTAVRQFVNGTSGGGAAPMQIGAMGYAGEVPEGEGGGYV